jgi:cell division protein DivIC
VKKLYSKIPPIAKNRYFITGILFLVWISFFDSYNFIFHSKLISQKSEYIKELDRLKSATAKNNEFIKKLQNPEFSEKYAREKFLMKKDGEDIFILE